MSKVVTIGATAFFACILCAAPLSLRLSPAGNVSLSVDSAEAVIGRPLTPMSVAGVNRRAHRRAYRHDYYGYGYDRPYRYGYGTYQPYTYGYATRPWNGYAYQPSNRNRYYQQPYYGNGYRNWTEF
jgi:hypothetical protein